MKAWRYRMAFLLDRLPGTCWTKLVAWAEGGGKVHPISDRRCDPICFADTGGWTRCYCGKNPKPRMGQ